MWIIGEDLQNNSSSEIEEEISTYDFHLNVDYMIKNFNEYLRLHSFFVESFPVIDFKGAC
jgi:hypothetical protein